MFYLFDEIFKPVPHWALPLPQPIPDIDTTPTRSQLREPLWPSESFCCGSLLAKVGGSQELGLLKMVSFEGAWLFEEPKRVTADFCCSAPSGSSNATVHQQQIFSL